MNNIVLSPIPLIDFKQLIRDCVSEALAEKPQDKETSPDRAVTAEYFCNTLKYMRPNTFYQRAPKGGVPGSFKVGSRWFVDVGEFESKSKAMMVE